MSKCRWSSRPPGWTSISSGSADGGWRRRNCSDSGTRCAAPTRPRSGKPKPLCYSSRRQRSKFNAQLSFLGEPADIILHPDDAAAHGIVDGQKVRVHNAQRRNRPRCESGCRHAQGRRLDPHGHEHANVNCLTSTKDVDPLGGMALYSGVPIAVEPLSDLRAAASSSDESAMRDEC